MEWALLRTSWKSWGVSQELGVQSVAQNDSLYCNEIQETLTFRNTLTAHLKVEDYKGVCVHAYL